MSAREIVTITGIDIDRAANTISRNETAHRARASERAARRRMNFPRDESVAVPRCSFVTVLILFGDDRISSLHNFVQH